MVTKSKTELRNEIAEQRHHLNPKVMESYSEEVLKHLKKNENYNNADTLLLYADFKNEVRTDIIFQDAKKRGKNIYYPKVLGETMDFFKVDDLDEIKKQYKTIREPSGDPRTLLSNKKNKNENICIIVPGLAFDKGGNRIGYGMGFYDRYFHRNPNLIKIAIAYDFQIVKEFESEINDVKMDYIITPSIQIKI